MSRPAEPRVIFVGDCHVDEEPLELGRHQFSRQIGGLLRGGFRLKLQLIDCKVGVKKKKKRKSNSEVNMQVCVAANAKLTWLCLTGVNERAEGEGAALNVKGEVVNVHPAAADQHLVVHIEDIAIILDDETGTRSGFVLFYPVWQNSKR